MTATLKSLIEEHDAAWANDEKLWGALGDAEDHPDLKTRPKLQVQTGKYFKGRDLDGNDVFDPIYSRTNDEIRAAADQSYRAGLGLFVREDDQAGMDERRAKFDRWADEKIAALDAIRAEIKEIEDKAGYTAASSGASASSASVRAIERAIIDYVPAGIAEAAAKANWVVTNWENQRGYVDDDEENLINALKAIGRASA